MGGAGTVDGGAPAGGGASVLPAGHAGAWSVVGGGAGGRRPAARGGSVAGSEERRAGMQCRRVVFRSWTPGATVDHHSHLGDHVHLAPGVHMGGAVTVDEGALVGVGASVLPAGHVGAWSVVGGGACVTEPVAPGATVV